MAVVAQSAEPRTAALQSRHQAANVNILAPFTTRPFFSPRSISVLTDGPEHHDGREDERDHVLLVPRDVHREGGHQAGHAQRDEPIFEPAEKRKS